MVNEGDLMWRAPAEWIAESSLVTYRRWLADRFGLTFPDYQALWRWSVSDLDAFWRSVWEYFGVESSVPPGAVLGRRTMPGAEWFPGTRVNLARELLRRIRRHGPVIIHRSESRSGGEIPAAELVDRVERLAVALRGLGVGEGDRVVGYLPSIPETTIAVLATAAIGAVWACCAPDFGRRTVLDRFHQLDPKVLIAVDGYRFGGRDFDRTPDIDEIIGHLPSLEAVIQLPYLHPDPPAPTGRRSVRWDDLLAAADRALFSFADVAFDHPLWVLFTSGTTGLPKGIVHSHGGIVIETLKLLGLNGNVGPDSRVFFYTSSGWVNFNILTVTPMLGATIVMYDGNPAYPAPDLLWQIADDVGATNFGVSPAYVQLLSKAGVRPRDRYRLDRLRYVTCTGSTVLPEHFGWLYREVKPEMLVVSTSGGTEVCTGFFTGAVGEPVHAGEMQVRGLGVAVEAWNEGGEPVVDEVGELVVREPMPSMPIRFWNDPGNRRYLDTYFDMWPGVWRHGDLLKVTPRGTGIISGRSDSTLNRHGVRIGTSDIYRIVDAVPGVRDSLAVNVDRPDGSGHMVLFLVPATGGVVTDDLESTVRTRLRNEGSPRHVPDRIVPMLAVPYTLTGKKMEVPVKRMLQGTAPERAYTRDAMVVPEAMDAYVAFAASFVKGGIS